MNELNSRKRIIAGSSLFIIGYWVLLISDWWPLRRSGIRGFSNYIDLNAVITWADCYKNVGNRVYLADDNLCSGYLYGVTLLKIINLLGFSKLNINLMGSFLIFLLSISFSYFLFANEAPIKKRFAIFAILYSPGICLLSERGNIDSVIYLLIFGACFAYSLKKPVIFILFISISTLFKFYTLPLLLLTPFFVKGIKYKFFSIISIITCTATVMMDIVKIKSDFPFTWYASFGNSTFGIWLNLLTTRLKLNINPINSKISVALGIFLFLLISGILWKLKNKNNNNSLVRKSLHDFSLHEIFMLCFGIIQLSCFLAGTNYDYRLIFTAAFFAVYVVYEDKILKFNLALVSILATAFWFSWFTFGYQIQANQQSPDWFIVMQFIGDISIFVISSIIAIQIIDILRRSLGKKI